MNLRTITRAAALAGALSLCMIRLALARLHGPLTPVQRARWLQSACRGVLRSMGVHCSAIGRPPTHGLVVSNHLSYLDIAVYSALMPCVFVSKAEVNDWPYFGLAARAGGSIFLDRSSKASAAAAAREIANRLKLPVPVLLFPEGTSTDGSQVQRFHSSLFQSAVDTGASITPAALRYLPIGDTPESELCWYGDAGFLPHVFKLLSGPAFSASVTFSEPIVAFDRRTAAHGTHQRVTALRAQAACETPVQA